MKSKKDPHNDFQFHDHYNSISGKKLLLTIFFNIIITLSEIIGGLLSGSLALLSDAFHNMSDVFSLIISYIALLVTGIKKDENKTFGYKRAEYGCPLQHSDFVWRNDFYFVQCGKQIP